MKSYKWKKVHTVFRLDKEQQKTYDKSSDNVKAIVDIVNSMQNIDVAGYSRNTHAIFDDYNLSGKQYLYDAGENTEHWMEYINDKVKGGLEGEHFIDLLRDIVVVCSALHKLLAYSEEELEDAETVYYGDDHWAE